MFSILEGYLCILHFHVSVLEISQVLANDGCRYAYTFPFLESKGIITIDDGRVGPLYEHTFPPSLAPSLSFIGIPKKVHISLSMLNYCFDILLTTDLV